MTVDDLPEAIAALLYERDYVYSASIGNWDTAVEYDLPMVKLYREKAQAVVNLIGESFTMEGKDG